MTAGTTDELGRPGEGKVPENVRDALYQVVMTEGPVALEQAFADLLTVQDERIRGALCATLSTSLLRRGPLPEDVLALFRVISGFDSLDAQRPVKRRVDGRGDVVTVMGSGKKGARCLNISTPSALLAGAAGGAVAKVGANCTSRITSSIELARAVGVNVEMPTDEMLGVLDTSGFGYFAGGEVMAPRFFATYKGVCVTPHALMFGWPVLAPVETATCFYGIAHPNVGAAAQVLAGLGKTSAVVVGSVVGELTFDECMPLGTTYEARVVDGRPSVDADAHKYAAELGLGHHTLEALRAQASARADIETTIAALRGHSTSAYADAIALNATGILRAGDPDRDVQATFADCRSLLRQGAGFEKLREVVDLTGGSPGALSRWTSS